MENEGSFSARVFTSNAVIPVADAYVSVVKPGTDGKEVFKVTKKRTYSLGNA